MELLQTDKTKIEILKTVSDGKSWTFYKLADNIGCSYDTLRPNCAFLKLLGFVEMMVVLKEKSASKKSYTSVTITDKGLGFLKNVRKL